MFGLGLFVDLGFYLCFDSFLINKLLVDCRLLWVVGGGLLLLTNLQCVIWCLLFFGCGFN